MTSTRLDGPNGECSRCGGHLGRSAGERLVRGRIEWSIETRCAGCDLTALECGRDTPTGPARVAILELSGHWRLRSADAAPGIAVLKCLRETFGLSLAGAGKHREALVAAGLSGTRGEMELLRERLAALGVATTISQDQADTSPSIPSTAG